LLKLWHFLCLENPTNQHTNQGVPPPLPSEIELEQMIDSILREDDFNSDGKQV
jgi:hypothetical protein